MIEANCNCDQNLVVSQFQNNGGSVAYSLSVAKRPRDPNELAKLIVDIATGDAEDNVSESKRHPSPKRKGGLKGGMARAKSYQSANP